MKKEMTWSNGCLHFCIVMTLSSLYRLSSLIGAIHPLILTTEQCKNFNMNWS